MNEQVCVSPRIRLLNINIDGAFKDARGNGGVGFVIRDERGCIQRMGALPIPRAQGIIKIWSKIHFESDAQGIIKMLHGETNVKANLVVLIRCNYFS